LFPVNDKDLFMNKEVRHTNLSDHNLVITETALEHNEMNSQTPTNQKGFSDLKFFNVRVNWAAEN